jgi:hypothetical protein
MVLQPWRLRSMQKGFPREAFFISVSQDSDSCLRLILLGFRVFNT